MDSSYVSEGCYEPQVHVHVCIYRAYGDNTYMYTYTHNHSIEMHERYAKVFLGLVLKNMKLNSKNALLCTNQLKLCHSHHS